MEQKHESDLTKKEKRALEIQKIKSLKGKKKVEYLLTYYRSVLLILIICIFMISMLIPVFQNAQKNPVLTLAVVDANYEADTTPLKEELLKYMGATGKHDEIVFDTTTTSSGNNVKLTILLLAEGDTDAVICNPKAYDFCEEKGVFLDWKELLGDSYSKYEMYMTNDILDLSKIPAWQEGNYTTYEPAYLGVLQTADHTEAVLQFLEYLTQ